MSTNETKVVCPSCGAEFAIPQHSHIATGLVVGSDSNLGTLYPELSKSEKMRQKKLKALKEAGIDVMNFFSIHGTQQQSMLVRMVDNQIEQVADDDPIVMKIMREGDIPNRRLFRRWVMSQMFHILKREGAGVSFEKIVNTRGYRYQWEVLRNEFKAQAKMFDEDREGYKERNIWFNKDTAFKAADNYLVFARVNIRCYSGVYHLYRKTGTGEESCRWIAEIQDKKAAIGQVQTPNELYRAVEDFYKVVKKYGCLKSMPLDHEFMKAYKNSGSYFTLKNLILFHNCFVKDEDGVMLSKVGSFRRLQMLADKQVVQNGQQLYVFMKDFIAYNNINIHDKIREWQDR